MINKVIEDLEIQMKSFKGASYQLAKNTIAQLRDVKEESDVRQQLLAMEDICDDTCIHYLAQNGNYPMICGECSRFYADGWEGK